MSAHKVKKGKKILPPLLPGSELATFRSRVRRSSNELSPAPTCILGFWRLPLSQAIGAHGIRHLCCPFFFLIPQSQSVTQRPDGIMNRTSDCQLSSLTAWPHLTLRIPWAESRWSGDGFVAILDGSSGCRANRLTGVCDFWTTVCIVSV